MTFKIHPKYLTIREETKQFCLEVKKYFIDMLSGMPRLCSVELLGSANRLTYVQRPRDFDFFLFYEDLNWLDISVFRKEIEDLFKAHEDKKVLDLVHMESKHRGFPYVKLLIKFNGVPIDVDIIPALKNPDHYGDIDRTKKHDQYMSENLSEEQKIEVRKLKYLLKRNYLYGAETQIKGFSGYACEVLINKYVRVENIPDMLHELIDPVDPLRNLLAAVSPENLRRFLFLKKNNFKNPNKYKPSKMESSDLYIWENPPLNVITTIKKCPFVLSAVYGAKNLYAELRPVIKECKLDLPYDNPVYREATQYQKVYFSAHKKVYKKYEYLKFLKQYPLMRKIKNTELKYLKLYHLLK